MEYSQIFRPEYRCLQYGKVSYITVFMQISGRCEVYILPSGIFLVIFFSHERLFMVTILNQDTDAKIQTLTIKKEENLKQKGCEIKSPS